MTIVHEEPARQPTLEERREDLQRRDTTLNTERKRYAHDLHKLHLAWQLLYPKASLREFLGWYGQGVVETRLYGYLRAGYAITRGLDAPHLRLGDLSGYGERLLHGESAESILSGAAPQLPPTTTIRVTRETADALDQTFSELSASDTRLTRQDALETAVQAFAHAPAVIRRALVHAASTGENPLDALVQAVDKRRDWRGWLSQQSCMVCGVRPVELHHVRVTANDRYRTHEVLAPICTRHHIARPGDGTDAAHTGQDEWVARHFGGYEAFWLQVALTYVKYAQETENP